jgi:hypothetical protein
MRKHGISQATYEAARIMVQDVELSVVRACSSVRLSRAAYYRPVEDSNRDVEIVAALNQIIAVELRWGFWKCYSGCGNSGGGGITRECIECIAQDALLGPQPL